MALKVMGTESVDGIPPSKRAKIETESPPLKTYLAVCFRSGIPTKYYIKFFSIQDLVSSELAPSTLIAHKRSHCWEPSPRFKRSLYWEPPTRFCRSPIFPKPEDTYHLSCSEYQDYGLETNPYTAMSFLFSEDNQCIYAVGGYPPLRPGTSIFMTTPPHLPNEVFCLPLDLVGENINNTTVFHETSMKTPKLFPLIVEIRRRIYVLSVSQNDAESAFEVYDLDNRDSGWQSLTPPPFIQSSICRRHYMLHPRYTYIVVDDRMLFVSDGLYSCVFDTLEGRWEECDLFSGDDFFRGKESPLVPEEELLNLAPIYGCGPGFPFAGQAVHWKDRIFLCFLRTGNCLVNAFQISSDYKRARHVKLCFTRPFMYGESLHGIVHLGDDHIAFVASNNESRIILTFKLNIVDNGVVHVQLKSERQFLGRRSIKFCFAV